MPKFLGFCVVLLFALSGCGGDLHFQIHFDQADGLKIGDALVLDGQTVGEVIALNKATQGGHVAEVALNREFAHAATENTRFFLAEDREHPEIHRIEMEQSRPDGKPITEDALVEGYSSRLQGLFPLGELFREFGNALRDLRGQVEQFRRNFEKVPDSDEARQLQEEWRRLMEEIQKAQSTAEGNLNQELLPKLREQLETLRKKLEALEKANPSSQGKPLEI